MKRAADVAEALYSTPRAPAPLGPLAPSHPHPAVVGINAFSSPLAIAVGDATPEPGACRHPCPLRCGAPGEPSVASWANRPSPAGYARSCGSASPRFAPSPGSQQSSYGSGLGAGLGSYGAPGVTGLGVPGSPSFLNGSTATSPFASECPQPTGKGVGPAWECRMDSALPSAHPGVRASSSCLMWVALGLAVESPQCSFHTATPWFWTLASILGSPGILGPDFLHLKPPLLTPVVHIASSPPMIVKPPLIRGTCAETWWTATFWSFAGTSGGGWRPLLEA